MVAILFWTIPNPNKNALIWYGDSKSEPFIIKLLLTTRNLKMLNIRAPTIFEGVQYGESHPIPNEGCDLFQSILRLPIQAI